LVLGDTKDWNDFSGQWYDEWALITWVDSIIFQWLRDTFLPILVNSPAEYLKPDEHEVSADPLLNEPGSNTCSLPWAPPAQKVAVFCWLPGEVCNLKWWLIKYFADHWGISTCMWK